ncbi:hypothetical protein EB820_23865 [Brevibacillus agri]|uniref:Uncharacterized protein n=1 Tax=Brevibacillus agri TaxID=51101 RepID=A0A3M8AAI6_9BACL|nr:hypothetical protein BA6348_16035 [Brevibacillus agri]RNB48122.1 hypothetical protein EB820_23865 [Brevibacillus agri]
MARPGEGEPKKTQCTVQERDKGQDTRVPVSKKGKRAADDDAKHASSARLLLREKPGTADRIQAGNGEK